MNLLDPKLGRAERIGSLVIGAALAVYALLGEFDHTWARGVLVVFGLAFAMGGIGGT